MSDSHPAATAEHAARRRAIKGNSAIVEVDHEVFVESSRLIITGPITNDATGLIEKLGLKALTESNYKAHVSSRQKALGILRTDLEVNVFEAPPGSAQAAIATLQEAKINAHPIGLFSLAPHDMGPFSYPETTIETVSPDRESADCGDNRVVIAVLDTGMPAGWQNWHQNNSVLAAIISADVSDPLYEAGGAAQIPPNLNEISAAGHGIFVSAIASRRTPPSVDIVAYRSSQYILSNAGPGGSLGPLLSSFEIAVDLISAALSVDAGTPLIFNLSFGGYATHSVDMAFLRMVLLFVENMHPGTVFCAAAGNKANFDIGPDYNEGTRPIYPAAFAAEAAFAGMVVSVGAIDPTSRTIAGFSGRGPWVTAWADGIVTAEYVPGRWINSATGNHDFDATDPLAVWSGTSFATPLVAAAIARGCASTGASPQHVWAGMQTALPRGLSWADADDIVRSEPGGIVR
jgi:Subtilase family